VEEIVKTETADSTKVSCFFIQSFNQKLKINTTIRT